MGTKLWPFWFFRALLSQNKIVCLVWRSRENNVLLGKHIIIATSNVAFCGALPQQEIIMCKFGSTAKEMAGDSDWHSCVKVEFWKRDVTITFPEKVSSSYKSISAKPPWNVRTNFFSFSGNVMVTSRFQNSTFTHLCHDKFLVGHPWGPQELFFCFSRICQKFLAGHP